uniref:Uncharacterized protein n=1 Tax=Octopus bimaculoides TaxID=37653 RepID=A0A0L8HZ69_OCTBM
MWKLLVEAHPLYLKNKRPSNLSIISQLISSIKLPVNSTTHRRISKLDTVYETVPTNIFMISARTLEHQIIHGP